MRFRPALNRPQPHVADEGTARIDHSPISGNTASRGAVGRENSRLGGDRRRTGSRILEPKVHCCQSEAGLVNILEVLWSWLETGVPSPRNNNIGADDRLAAGVLGQLQKRRSCGYIKDRCAVRSVKNSLGGRPAAAANPR